MDTIQITNSILNQKVVNQPTRFDMAINFYICIKKGDKYFLVTYFYNPNWNKYYPFYDDINKTPIFKQSSAKVYKELILETDQTIQIDEQQKLQQAHKRFFELIGCNCKTIKAKNNILYELKFSKTSNIYTIYKLYNYIVTQVDDINSLLNPKNLKCKLYDLDDLNEEEIISNAIWFSKISYNELKENAIHI